MPKLREKICYGNAYGTPSMAPAEDGKGLKPAYNAEEMIYHLPFLWDEYKRGWLDIEDIRGVRGDSRDHMHSDRALIERWVRAKEEQGYEGVFLNTGSDQGCSAAYRLSNHRLFSSFPVFVVFSDNPVAQANSDAYGNFLTAYRAFTEFEEGDKKNRISGVNACVDSQIMRGTRIIKMGGKAGEKPFFESPHYDVLAVLMGDKLVYKEDGYRAEEKFKKHCRKWSSFFGKPLIFEYPEDLYNAVAGCIDAFELTENTTTETLKEKSHLSSMYIKGFGGGGIRWDLLPVIQEWTEKRGKLVAAGSKNPYSVCYLIDYGHDVIDLGVVPLGDMSADYALSKDTFFSTLLVMTSGDYRLDDLPSKLWEHLAERKGLLIKNVTHGIDEKKYLRELRRFKKINDIIKSDEEVVKILENISEASAQYAAKKKTALPLVQDHEKKNLEKQLAARDRIQVQVLEAERSLQDQTEKKPIDERLKPTVLFVENMPDTAHLLKALVEAKGCSSASAATGAEAVEEYMSRMKDGKEVDAIVLDMHLDDMTGDGIADAMRKINPDAKFIMLTGDKNAVRYRDREKYVMAFMKPCKDDEIDQIVHYARAQKLRREKEKQETGGKEETTAED